MKTGVYICHCGSNIAGTVDCAEVARWAGELENVAVSRDYKFMCSSLGQELIEKDIKELGVDRVVVASCSPHMHEPTFRGACERAGVNPYMFEMANIREHCSWVHTDKDEATKKAKALVAAAVGRVTRHQPLTEKHAPVNKNTLIVGGGVAGIQAALEIANAGYHVYLVEREPSLGGHMAQLDKTFPTLDCSACILTPRMFDAGNHGKGRRLYRQFQGHDSQKGALCERGAVHWLRRLHRKMPQAISGRSVRGRAGLSQGCLSPLPPSGAQVSGD
jgi:heterodisulfide reductase subunit A